MRRRYILLKDTPELKKEGKYTKQITQEAKAEYRNYEGWFGVLLK